MPCVCHNGEAHVETAEILAGHLFSRVGEGIFAALVCLVGWVGKLIGV